MRRHQIYRYLPWLLMMVLLTACGSKENSRGINGYVYVAEELPMPVGGSYYHEFKVQDGYLYCQVDSAVYRLPVEALAEGKKVSSGEMVFDGDKAGGRPYDYVLDGEGGGYYALMKISLNMRTWENEIARSVLVRQRADGTEGYRLDLDKLDLSNVSLAVDGEGRVFLLTTEGLNVVDTEGNLVAAIPGSKFGTEFQSGSGRLLEGEGGSIYYSPAYSWNVIYEILGDDTAFREGTFRMERIELPSYGRCYSAPQGILYGSGDGMLYRYRKEEAKWETLLRFADSNLMGQPEQVLWLSDERMLANYYYYPDQELYSMRKADASLLPEEDELVLAALGLSRDLEKYIAEFSRSSGCHVAVEYYQGENWGAGLDAAMVSSHPPDLIVLEDATALKLAEKGVLEDLAPYLEVSTALDREEFLENVLDGYTIGGRLVGVPDSFYVYVAVGRSSQLGSEAGWTAAEAMAFAEAHPEAQLFRTPTFTSMLAFFQEYILESCIDWESGECSFDGEEFHKLAMWMGEHSDGFGSGYACSFDDSWDFDGEVFPESQLLSPDCLMPVFHTLVEYELRFGEDITAIGYPTADGRASYTVHANNVVGIAAGSKNKETAWQFIEEFLAQDRNYDRCLPSRKGILEKIAEEESTFEYKRDDNGEICLYKAGEQEGEPVMKSKGVFRIGGEQISYYGMTQEQADTMMEIIKAVDFTPSKGGLRYDIMDILLEELASYIEGKRTLEESARILQNRVQNLVQENM